MMTTSRRITAVYLSAAAYLVLMLGESGIFTDQLFFGNQQNGNEGLPPRDIGQRRLPGGRAAPSLTLPQNSTTNFQLPQKDRVITFVHVGKAGGVTLRSETAIVCAQPKYKYTNPAKVQECLDRHIPKGNVLSRAVYHYFHVSFLNTTELELSTSFLLPLRNPIDRIQSAYRFHHPVNCNQPKYDQPGKGRPFGCVVLEQQQPAQYLLYHLCFPNAAMEDFAQSILSPWTNHSHFANLTWAQQHYCRYTARRAVQGHYLIQAGPHFFHNYEYYRNWTLEAYPDKEVLGVRTSQEWQDMRQLDLAMGGNGVFRQPGYHNTHGSEFFERSPLSTQAYRKLCCVLEREIDMYRDIVNRVLNFNDTVKAELMEEVRVKCAIEDWDEWRQQCQQRLQADEQELKSLKAEGRSQFKKRVKNKPQGLPARGERGGTAVKQPTKQEQPVKLARDEEEWYKQAKKIG